MAPQKPESSEMVRCTCPASALGGGCFPDWVERMLAPKKPERFAELCRENGASQEARGLRN
eukprot:5122051-Karenia_brevis.AAC.1